MLAGVYEWSGVDYLHSSIDFEEVGVCNYHEVILLKCVDLDQQLARTVDYLKSFLLILLILEITIHRLRCLIDLYLLWIFVHLLLYLYWLIILIYAGRSKRSCNSFAVDSIVTRLS